jgi:hypothetical protein
MSCSSEVIKASLAIGFDHFPAAVCCQFFSQHLNQLVPNPRNIGRETAQKSGLVLTKIEKLLGMCASGLELRVDQCAKLFPHGIFSLHDLLDLAAVPSVPAREYFLSHLFFATEMAINRGLAHPAASATSLILVASTPLLANKEVAAATIAGRFVPGFCLRTSMRVNDH